MLAFGQGVADASELPWSDIPQKYNTFLTPMRPMDAAAYQRGLEYALLCSDIADWQSMKNEFVEAYKSGSITSEGTLIRKMGTDAASDNFKLKISQRLKEVIASHPELPPQISKYQAEEENNI